MGRRHEISDADFARVSPLMTGRPGQHGGLAEDNRRFLNAVLYVARTGIPWRDLPAEFGAWDAVYNRFRRWAASGGLRWLFEALTADPGFGEVRRVLIDSTVVRAHHHAAGARRIKSGSGRPGRRPPRASAAAAAG